MAMNIKDPEAERLATELAGRTGESKTAAIREALRERLARVTAADESVAERAARMRTFLENEIWPHVPPDQLGKRLTKEEEEEILGIGPEGY